MATQSLKILLAKYNMNIMKLKNLKKECMVIIMKSNHLNIRTNDLIHKSQRKHAIALHKLYTLEKLKIPSVKDIIIKRISLTKHFNEFFGGLDEFEVNEDEMFEDIEMCNFLGIDYDGIVPYDPRSDMKF